MAKRKSKNEKDTKELTTEESNKEKSSEEKKYNIKNIGYIHPTILQDESLSLEQKVETEAKRRKALRNEITHKLRFQILERDKSTCQLCGVKPGDIMSNGEPAKFEIDHIIPLEKGGDNEPKNLWTLCWVCNEGKKTSTFTPPKTQHKVKIEEIKKIAVDSDFTAMMKFLSDENNEEERKWLYDLHTEKQTEYCIKDCKKCVDSDNWYYRRCFVFLHQHAVVDDNRPSGELDRSANRINVHFDNKNNSLKCDFCFISQLCPQFKVSANCAYDFTADVDFTDIESAMKILLNLQKERVLRGGFFEKSLGGAIDKNLSGEIDRLNKLLVAYNEIKSPSLKFNVSAEGKGEGTGVVANLLAGIFGGASNNNKSLPEEKKQLEQHKAETEDVEIVSVEKEKVDVKEKGS